MNYFYRIAIQLIACAILLNACNKELGPYIPEEEELVTPADPFMDKKIEASISGQIMDETGNYLSGVTVKIGSITVITGDDGVFEINNAKLGKEFGLITAEKSGYYIGKRTVLASANKHSFIRLQLMPKKRTGSFNASSGGEIIMEDGTKLVFDPNSIIKATDSSAYAGQVTVFASLTDINSESFFHQKIGDLRGILMDGKLAGISPYGMITVELESDQGETLQLAKNKPATLNMEIPPSLRAKAPTNSSLFHFENNSGMWEEVGTAVKSGNFYIAKLNHFSSWTMGVPFGYNAVHGVIYDSTQNRLPYLRVEVKDEAGQTISTAFTDIDGSYTTWVPQNQNVTMNIWSNNCQLHSTLIQSKESEIQHGIISILLWGQKVVTFNGFVADCDLKPMKRGFVYVERDGLKYKFNLENGAFIANVMACGEENEYKPYQVYVTDINENKLSIKRDFSASVSPIAFDNLFFHGCATQLENFIEIEFNDQKLPSQYPFIKDYEEDGIFEIVTLGHNNMFIGFSNVKETNFVASIHTLIENATYQGDVNFTITNPSILNYYLEFKFEGILTEYDNPDQRKTIKAHGRVQRGYLQSK